MFSLDLQRLTARLLILVLLGNPVVVAAKSIDNLIEPIDMELERSRIATRQALQQAVTQQLSRQNNAVAVQRARAQTTSTGVEVDTNAAAAQQAGLRTSANGTQVIDIATPTQAGVSHNKFLKFNVSKDGLILNNSLDPAISALGGWTDGNRRLAGGTARLILAEVTGNSASSLLGYTEILGDAAEFVLANANGITCNGCGFINTPRVVFATGIPELTNGQLSGFSIGGGNVVIDGDGLNASNIGRFDILTRAMSLNASLYANELNILTGANYYDYQTGEYRVLSGSDIASSEFQFALDASALGAMYANSISLIGTEAGLGVRSEGLINSVTDMELTADGQLQLKQAVANGSLKLTSVSGDINTDGTVYSQNTQVNAGGNLVNTGLLASGSDLAVQAGAITQDGQLIAGLDSAGQLAEGFALNVNSAGQFDNSGQLLTLSNINLNAGSFNNLEQGTVQANNLNMQLQQGSNLGIISAVELNIGGGQFSNANHLQGQSLTLNLQQFNLLDGVLYQTGEQGAFVFDGGNFSIDAGLFVTDGNASLTATGNIVNNSDWLAKAALTVNAAELLNTGTLQNQALFTATLGALQNSGNLLFSSALSPVLTIEQRLRNSGLIQFSSENLLLAMKELDNTQGKIYHLGQGKLELNISGNLTNDQGEILSNQDVQLQAQTLNNAEGTLAGQAMTINAAEINNQQGTLQAQQLNISGQQLNNQSGNIYGLAEQGESLAIKLAQKLDNTEGKIISQGNQLNLEADTLINQKGTIALTGDGQLQLKTGQLLDNNEGIIQAKQQLNIDSQKLLNQKGNISAEGLTVKATELNNSEGNLIAQQLELSGDSLINQQGVISATAESGEALKLSFGQSIDNSQQGLMQSAGENLQITTQVLNNQQGQIILGGNGQLTVDSQNLDNSQGTLVANNQLQINSNQLNNTQGTISAVNRLTLDGQQIDNSQGTIASTDLILTSINLINNGGVLQGSNQAQISTNNLSNNKGSISAQRLELNLTELQNAEGKLIAEVIAITAGRVNNQQGQIAATSNQAGAFSLTVQELDNQQGELIAQNSDMRLALGQFNNQQGTVFSAGDINANINAFNNQQGALNSQGQISLDSSGVINNNEGQINASNNVSINANGLNNQQGNIQSQQNLSLNINGDLDNTQGTILTTDQLNIRANEINNNAGNLIASNGLTINASRLNNAGVANVSANNVVINAGSLNNAEGARIQATDMQLNISQIDNGGLLLATGTSLQSLILNARTLNNTGRIDSYGQNLVLSNMLLNNQGQINHFGTGVLTLEALGQMRNSRGVISTQGDMIIDTRGIDNAGGQLLAKGKLTLKTDTLSNQTGLLRSGDDLSVDVKSLDNAAGRIENLGGKQASIKVEGALNNQGGSIIVKAAEASIDAKTINNTKGNIIAGDEKGGLKTNLTITTTELNNAEGRLAAWQGDLSIKGLDKLDNSKGQIIAGGETLLIEAPELINKGGRIEHTGTGQTTINSKNLDNTDAGQIIAASKLLINSDVLNSDGLIQGADVELNSKTLDNQGQISAKTLQLQADKLTNSGNILADSAVVKAADINNSGVLQVLSTDDNKAGLVLETKALVNTGVLLTDSQDLNLANIALNNNKGKILHQGLGVLTIEALEELNNNQGQIRTKGNLVLKATKLDNNSGVVEAGKGAAITLADIDNTQGKLNILGDSDLELTVSNNLLNQQGEINANSGKVVINAKNLQNQQGKIQVKGQLNINADTLDNQGAEINAGQLQAQLKALNNQQGRIIANLEATQSLELQVQGKLDNSKGLIFANGQNATISAATLDNSEGTLEFKHSANLSVNQLNNLLTGKIIATDLQLSGAGLNNQGNIVTATLKLNTTNVTNSGHIEATATGGQSLQITSTQLTNSGTIISRGQDLQLHNLILNNNNGRIVLAGNGVLSIETLEALQNQQGELISGGELKIKAGQLHNQQGLLQSAGNSELLVTDLFNQKGNINATGGLTIRAGQLNNSEAQIVANQLTANVTDINNQQGKLIATQQGVDSLNLTVANHLNNQQGQILAAGKSATIQTKTLQNDAGQISLAGDGQLSITAGQLNNLAGGQIQANNSLQLNVQQLDNQAQIAARNLQIQSQSISNSGQLTSEKQLTINAGQLTNSGQINTETATVNLDSFNNQGQFAVSGSEGESLKLAVKTLRNSGKLAVNGADFKLEKVQLDNTGGELLHFGQGVLNIEALDELTNLTGKIMTQGDLVLVAGQLNNNQGLLQIAKSAGIDLQSLNNLDGKLMALGEQMLRLTVQQHIQNQQGLISAGQLNIKAASFDNQQATIVAHSQNGAGLDLSLTGKLDNRSGKVFSNGQDLSLTLGELDNRSGNVEHKGTGTLTVQGNSINNRQQGQILANGQLVLSANNLDNEGKIASVGNMRLTLSQTLDNLATGQIQAADLNMNIQQLDNAGVIQGNNVQLQGNTLNNSGKLFATADLNINNQLLNNNQGLIQAGAAVDIDAAELRNTNGKLVLLGQQNASIDVQQLLNNQQGQILSNSQQLAISSKTLQNQQGKIQGLETVNITADNLVNQQGQLLANNALLKVGQIDNTQAGQLQARQNLQIESQRLTNNGTVQAQNLTLNTADLQNQQQGKVQAQTLTISGQTLVNQGQIAANDATLTIADINNQNEIQAQNKLIISGNKLVNQQGNIISQKQLMMTVDEINNNQGKLHAEQLTIRGNNLNNLSGEILADGQLLDIELSQKLTNQQGKIAATGQNARIKAATLDNSGDITHSGNQKFTLDIQQLNNLASGKISAANLLDIDSTNLDNAGILQAQNLNVLTTTLTNSKDIQAANATVKATTLTNQANLLTQNLDLTLDNLNNSGLLAANAETEQSLKLTAKNLTNTGTLASRGDKLLLEQMAINNQNGQILHFGQGVLTIDALNSLNNQSGVIHTEGNLALTADELDNRSGTLVADNHVINSQVLLNQQGKITARENIQITGQNLQNQNGQILALGTGNNNLAINLQQQLQNQQGLIYSGGESATVTAAALNNQQGRVIHKGTGQLSLNVTSTDNTSNGQIQTNGSLKLVGDNLQSDGNITASQMDIKLQTLTNQGKIQANTLAINSQNLTNSGQLNSQQLSYSGQNLNNAGVIAAHGTTGQSLQINAANLTNSGLLLSKGQDLSLSQQTLNNQGGRIVHQGSGVLTLEAQNALINQAGSIQTDGSLKLTANTLNNQQGLVQVEKSATLALASLDNREGKVLVFSDQALNINASSNINNNNGTIGAQNLTVSTGVLDNQAGKIIGSNSQLSFNQLNNQGGTVVADQLQLTGGNIVNAQGQIAANDSLNMNLTGQLNNQQGKILAQGNSFAIRADSLNNNSGLISQKAANDASINISNGITNTQGTINAAGKLVLTAGTLDNQGDVNASQLQINAGSTTNQGKIQANNLNLQGQQLTNSGLILATGEQQRALNIDMANGSTNTGVIQSHGQDLIFAQQVNNDGGKIIHAGTGVLQLEFLSNQNGLVHSQQDLLIKQGNTNNQQGTLQALKNLTINGSSLDNRSGTIKNGAGLNINLANLDNRAGNIQQTGGVATLAISNEMRNQDGKLILQQGDLDITTLTNGNGVIAANQGLDIDATTLSNQGGLLRAKQLDINAAQLNNNQNGVLSAQNLSITSNNLNNNSGRIESSQQMALDLQQASNQQGTILSGGSQFDLKLAGQLDNSNSGLIEVHSRDWLVKNQDINNQQGTLRHMGDGTLRFEANKQLNNQSGVIVSQGNIQMQLDGQTAGTSLNNQAGTIRASGVLDIDTAHQLNNNQGTLVAGNNLMLDATAVNNQQGKILAARQLALTLSGNLNNNQGLLYTENGAMTVTAHTLDNLAGALLQKGAGALALSLNTLNSSGEIGAGTVLDLDATTVNNSGLIRTSQVDINAANLRNSGTIAANNLTLTTNALNNNQGRLLALATSGESLKINTSNQVSNQQGLIQSHGSNLSINAGLDNTSGQVLLLSNGQLTLANVQNQQGKIQSQGNVQLNQQVLNNSGLIQAANDLDINATTLSNNGGSVHATGKLDVDASQITNQGGKIVSAGDHYRVNATGNIDNSAGGLMATAAANMQISGASFNNQQGNINHQGNGALSLTGFNQLNNDGGNIVSQGNLALNLDSLSNNSASGKKAVISANQTQLNVKQIENNGGVLQGNQLNIDTDSLSNRGGVVLAQGTTNQSLTLKVDGNLTNTAGGVIESRGQNLNLSQVQQLNNNAGAIRHHGSGQLTINQSGDLDNTSGQLITKGQLQLNAARLRNNGGTISAQQSANVGVNYLDNQSGRVEAARDLTLNSTAIIDGNGGALIAGQNANITTNGSLNSASGRIFAGNRLDVRAGTLNNNNGVTGAGDTAVINANGYVTSVGGVIQANRSVSVTGTSINNNNGNMQSANLTLNSGSSVSNSGGQLSGGQLTIYSSSVDNSGGTLVATGSNSNSLDLSRSGGINNNNGTIASYARDWNLSLANISNSGGRLLHQGTGVFRLSQSGQLNNTGTIASAGNLQLNVGSVNNNGYLQAANDLSISGSVENRSSGVMVGRNISVTGAGSFNNQGKVSASNQLTVNASSINNQNLMYSAGTANLNANSITNSGNMSASQFNASGFNQFTNSGRVEGGGLNFSGSTLNNQGAGVLVASGNAGMSLGVSQLTNAGTIYNQGANMSFGGSVTNSGRLVHAGGGELTLGDKGSVNIEGGSVATAGTAKFRGSVQGTGSVYAEKGMVIDSSGTFVNSNSKLYTKGNLQINSAVDNQSGTQIADGTLGINTTGKINNNNGTLQGNNLDIKAGSITNTGGTITSLGSGNASVVAGSINNNNGTIQSTGNQLTVRTTSGDLQNAGGKIVHGGSGGLSVNVAGNLSQDGGEIKTQGTVTVNAASQINNSNATIAGSQVNLSAGGALTNTSGDIIGFGSGASQVAASGINNAGGKIAANGSSLKVNTGDLDNRDGSILYAGTGALTVTSADLSNDGSNSRIISNGTANVHGGREIDNSGVISSAGKLTLTASGIQNDGVLASRENLVDITTGNLTNEKTISGLTGVDITASAIRNSSGRIQSDGTVKINTGSLSVGTITGGNLDIDVRSNLALASGEQLGTSGNLDLDVSGSFNNRGSVLATGTMDIGASSVTNYNTMRSGGNATLGGTRITNSGTLSSNSTLTLNAYTVNSGTLAAGGTLDINGGLHNTNLTFAGSMLDINGSVTNNNSIYSAGNASISNGTVTNNGGSIAAANNMNISGTINNNRNGSATYSGPVTKTVENYPDGGPYGLGWSAKGYDNQGKKNRYITKTITTTTTYSGSATGNAGVIAAGGNLSLNGNITNNYSTISAGGNLYLSGSNLTNKAIQNRQEVKTVTVREHWLEVCLQGFRDKGRTGPFTCHEPGDPIKQGETEVKTENEVKYTGGGAAGTIAAGGSILGSLAGRLEVTDGSPVSANGRSTSTSASGSRGSATRGSNTGSAGTQTASVNGTSGTAASTSGQNRQTSGTNGTSTGVNTSGANASGSFNGNNQQTAATSGPNTNVNQTEATNGQTAADVAVNEQDLANNQTGTNLAGQDQVGSGNVSIDLARRGLVTTGGDVGSGRLDANGQTKQKLEPGQSPDIIVINDPANSQPEKYAPSRNGTFVEVVEGDMLKRQGPGVAVDLDRAANEGSLEVVRQVTDKQPAPLLIDDGPIGGRVVTKLVVDDKGSRKDLQDPSLGTPVSGDSVGDSLAIVLTPTDDRQPEARPVISDGEGFVTTQPVIGVTDRLAIAKVDDLGRLRKDGKVVALPGGGTPDVLRPVAMVRKDPTTGAIIENRVAYSLSEQVMGRDAQALGNNEVSIGANLGVNGQSPDQNYRRETRAEYLTEEARIGSEEFLNEVGHNPDVIVRDQALNHEHVVKQATEQTPPYNPNTDTAAAEYAAHNSQPGSVRAGRNVFISEAQMKVLTEDLGFDADSINQGQDKLYAAIDKNDLLADGVTIGAGEFVDIRADQGITLGTGISAEEGLVLRTDGPLQVGLGGTFHADKMLGLQLGGDFNNTMDLQSDNLWLDVGGDFTNEGTLKGNTSLDLSAGGDFINNSKLLSDGGLAIHAGNDLINMGGSLISGVDVSLNAGNDIINRTEFSQHTVQRRGKDNWTYTAVGPEAKIVSGNSLSMNAGNDIDLQGSNLAAAGDINLYAGNDVLLGAVERKSGHERYFKGGHDIRYDVTYDTVSMQAGGNLSVIAGNNLQSEGANFAALGDVSLAAGNEMNLLGVVERHEEKKKRTKKSTFKKKIYIDEKTTATHHGTSILAGGNVNLNAINTEDGTQLFNSGDVLMEGTQIQAGGDLLAYTQGEMNIVSGEEWQSETHIKKKSYLGGLFGSSKTKKEDVQYLGHANLATGGDITILAQSNINVLAGNINAQNIKAQAGFGNEDAQDADINILGEEQTKSLYEESRRHGLTLDFSDNFLSVAKETAKENQQTQTDYVGSTFVARDNIALKASRDVNIVGSSMNAGGDIGIDAGRDVNLIAGVGTRSGFESEEVTKMGIGFSGDDNGFSVFAGEEARKNSVQYTQTLLTGTELNAGKNVFIKAGNDINQVGSDVNAGEDITFKATNDINIVSARELADSLAEESLTRTGLTVGVQHNLGNTLDALGNIGQGDNAVTQASNVMRAADALNNAGSSSNAHIGVTTTTMSMANNAQSAVVSNLDAGGNITLDAGGDVTLEGTGVWAGGDISISGEDINIVSAYDVTQNQSQSSRRQTGISANATSENASVTAGFSQSRSENSTASTTALGASLNAGGNIQLDARNDLTLEGAEVFAGEDIHLAAGNDINIVAAANTNNSESEDSHSSAGGGLNFGSEGVGVRLEGAIGKGEQDRQSTTYTNSQVVAGGTLSITSGNDTTIAGANLFGEDVDVNVGGDLTVASVQDTGSVDGSRWDVSLGATIGISGPSSFNASVGAGNTTGSTAWVDQQTSIVGSGSVNINVGGHTQVDGALIANVDSKGNDGGNLNISTGTFGFTDFQDHDNEQDSYLSVSYGNGDNPSTNGVESNSTYGVEGHHNERDREQVTRATIGAGNIEVRDDQDVDLSGLNRDIDKAQEITKDEEESTGLYVTSTAVDSMGRLVNTPQAQSQLWAQNVLNSMDPNQVMQAFTAMMDAGGKVTEEVSKMLGLDQLSPEQQQAILAQVLAQHAAIDLDNPPTQTEVAQERETQHEAQDQELIHAMFGVDINQDESTLPPVDENGVPNAYPVYPGITDALADTSLSMEERFALVDERLKAKELEGQYNTDQLDAARQQVEQYRDVYLENKEFISTLEMYGSPTLVIKMLVNGATNAADAMVYLTKEVEGGGAFQDAARHMLSKLRQMLGGNNTPGTPGGGSIRQGTDGEMAGNYFPQGDGFNINWGKNANQIDHTTRHLESGGFNVSVVQDAIVKDLSSKVDEIAIGHGRTLEVDVGGVKIEYTVHKLPDGSIRVGSIRPPRNETPPSGGNSGGNNSSGNGSNGTSNNNQYTQAGDNSAGKSYLALQAPSYKVPSDYTVTKNADGSATITGPRGGKYNSTGFFDQNGKQIYRDGNGAYYTLDGGRKRTSAPTDYTSIPIHHICTNKCYSGAGNTPAWTPRFKQFFDDAGLNINGEINKIAVPGHRGPHPQAYHQYIYSKLQNATRGIQPNTPSYRVAVERILRNIKQEAVKPGSQVNKWLTGG